MTRRRTLVAGLVLAALVAVWWAFGHQTAPEPSKSQPTAAATADGSAPPPVRSTSPTPSPTAASTAGAETEDSASTDLSEAEQAEVIDFAHRFMDAFARPAAGTGLRAWWDRVAAMLTESAIEDFVGIDPSLIPFTKVTGPVVLVTLDGAEEAYWLQTVDVQTDAGTWRLTVQLVTPGISEQLLVSSIEELES